MGAGEGSVGSYLNVRVPAKLNLFLAVKGQRADGFHELVTVFQSVSIYDELRVALVGRRGWRHHPAARRRMRVELWVDPGIPEGPRNLALQAARRLGEATGIPSGARAHRDSVRTIVDLEKRIPMAAGMAGGSADAAAALVGLNRLWGCDLSSNQLRELAADLGSDVPFCITGGTALATGRGTAVAPVLCRGQFWWVICPDPQPLATEDVYRSWDDHGEPMGMTADAVLQALRSGDPKALGAALHNELEPAAFALRPDLAERKSMLVEAGAAGTVLTGSGPTLLALATDEQAARSLADRIAGDVPETIVATSPAGGPEVRERVRATNPPSLSASDSSSASGSRPERTLE